MAKVKKYVLSKEELKTLKAKTKVSAEDEEEVHAGRSEAAFQMYDKWQWIEKGGQNNMFCPQYWEALHEIDGVGFMPIEESITCQGSACKRYGLAKSPTGKQWAYCNKVNQKVVGTLVKKWVKDKLLSCGRYRISEEDRDKLTPRVRKSIEDWEYKFSTMLSLEAKAATRRFLTNMTRKYGVKEEVYVD